MPNAFAALTPTIVSGIAMTALGNKPAFLTDFSTDFSGEIKRKSVVQVPLYSGGNVLVDATNFAQSNTSSSTINIAPKHLYMPISLNFNEFNYFHKLETQIGNAVNHLVDAMQAIVFSTLSAVNFNVAVAGVADTALTTTHLQSAWASVQGTEKVMYLNSTAYSKFLPTNLESFDAQRGNPAFGFTKFAWADSFQGAETGVYGFVSSDRKGIAVAAGLPEINVPEVQSMVIDLGNGLQAKLTSFNDPNTRTEYMAVESMFGAAVGDNTAIRLIRS